MSTKDQVDKLARDYSIKSRSYQDEYKQRMDQLKHYTAKSIADAVATLQNEDERIDILSYLYWHYCDLPAKILTSSFGLRETQYSQVHRLILPIEIERECRECGAEFITQVNSRSSVEYKDGVLVKIKYVTHYTCTACRARASNNHQIWLEAEKTRISRLKTMPYVEYLQTTHWQEQRRRALKRARFQCQLCNGKGQLHVHHRAYNRRGEEYASDLIVLCPDCHAKFHDKLAEVQS